MSQWDAVRAIARARRSAFGESGSSATLLIKRASAATRIGYALLPAGHPRLYGAQGVYDPEYRMIWVDASLPTETRNFVLAQPDAAPRLWAGTFHAFALELLRKYAEGRIDVLKPGFALIDPVDARLQFESVVTALGLLHYDDLADPTAPFPAFFSAFSRAQDELADPETYTALVAAMDASDDRARAMEVTRAYVRYQDLLREMNGCDFGDLLLHAVRLLRDWPEVRQSVQAQYRHILVDEYQDVNRASRELLRLLAGDGTGLWVVGDARQAIYGFRGASHGSLRDFPQDYSGASVVRLERNYRSRRAIVDWSCVGRVEATRRTAAIRTSACGRPLAGHGTRLRHARRNATRSAQGANRIQSRAHSRKTC